MKRKLATLFLAGTALLAVTASATAADAPSIAGKWQVHLSVADREVDLTCTFAQEGADLNGSCGSERGTSEITGKVDGNKVTWTQKTSGGENGPVTLQFRGSINSATDVKGFVTVAEYGIEGQFTATPAAS